MFVVIPTWGLNAKHGGVRVLCELASGLVARGHRVRFLAFAGEGAPAFPTTAEIAEFAPPPDGRWLWRDLRRQDLLRRAIEQYADADVIFANQHLTARPVHEARVRARKFYYIQAYEPDFYPRGWWRWPQIRLAEDSYRYPLEHIANCAMVARQAHGAGWEQVPILPPGLDPALYTPAGRGPAGRPLVVGTIGRREPWKGSADCFKALSLARAHGVELDFRVAFGNIPQGFEALARHDDAPRNDHELVVWYRSLDILISAIHWGGAPYPPLEAMACGTAVVSTPNEHVSEGRNALTAPQEDPLALARALVRMCTDVPLREALVAQGVQDAAAHHWPRLVARLEQLFMGRVTATEGDAR